MPPHPRAGGISQVYPWGSTYFDNVVDNFIPSSPHTTTLSMIYPWENTALNILIKFILQLNILETNETIRIFLNDIEYDNLIINLGFKKIDKEQISNFLSYIFLDFLVLILIIINQFILIRRGLWYMTESDYETIEESKPQGM